MTNIGSLAVTLTPGTSYQMRFDVIGSSLQGRIFLSSDLSRTLVNVLASDGTYTSGISGLLVAGNGDFTQGGTAADATFDNYLMIAVPEPTVILGVSAFAGLAVRRLRKSRAKS